MVGLLLLSAMVVVIGTVAAMREPAMFYGWLTDANGNPVPAGTNVNIVLLDKYWWNTTTDGSGYYEVMERYCVTSTDCSAPNICVEQTYHMYIDGVYAGFRQLIASHTGPSDFIWHPDSPCYWSYQWNRHIQIPEFSTIAIPIISILGLLFFFNRRKHRKG